MLDVSNEEYLSNLSSEINAKNDFLSKRKRKIHNSIAHFHQVSNDIHNRNQVLQSYTLKMLKTKQKLEKDKKSFQNFQNQKKLQLEKDFSLLESKLDELTKEDEKFKQETNKRNELKQQYNKIIKENEKKIQDIENKNQKSKNDLLRLKDELEQQSIVNNETQSHCLQFLECINSLDKDFDLIKKSKENIYQKQFIIKQQIDLEKSKHIQQKTQILVQTQSERMKQDELRKEKKKYLQLNEKYKLKLSELNNNQSKVLDSLYHFNQKLKETSKNQSNIIQQISKIKNNKKIIKNRYSFPDNTYTNKNQSNSVFNKKSAINTINQKLNYLVLEIEKNQCAKKEIYSKINIEKLTISQHFKEINFLQKEVEDSFTNYSVDSTNFPFIFDFLNELMKLEKYSRNEIEKWKNCSFSTSNIDSMLRKWDKRISFYE